MPNDFTGADKVYIACGYTDLRKGIDSLARLVHQQFELDQFTNCLSRENGRKLLKTQAFCRILWYNVCMENREMQTSNTAEMVTISRAEYERFQEQAQVITSLTLQNEWLLEQLKLSKKKLFGRSSEQAEQMVMEQLSFTYVPAGTGIQPSGAEAVPADDGQLAAEGFGEMAAAGLRCAA